MSGTAHSDEELLRHGLHELAGAEDPTTGPLGVDGLVARGRQSRARRRAALATASFALAGVVTAGGVYVTDSGGRDGGDDIAVSRTAVPRLMPVLRGLLPPGRVSQEHSTMNDGSGDSYLTSSLIFDDGKGASFIKASVTRFDSPMGQVASWVLCADTPTSTCEEQALPDGSFLYLDRMRRDVPGSTDLVSWGARLRTPDDTILDVTAVNAPAESGAAPSRQTPALTEQQLKDIVTSRKWGPTLALLPDYGGGVTEKGAPSGTEIVGALRELLPSPLKPLGWYKGGTSPAYYATQGVDDGKGEALIEVLIGHRGTNDTGRMRVTSQDGPYLWSQAGTLRRSVTATRPGGFEVTVSVYNAACPHCKPTRSTQPLTTQQLKAIATSDRWDELEP